MAGFKVIYQDTDSTFRRKVYANQRRYHFIRITDMDDACGKDNEGRPKYVAELLEVDLDLLTDGAIKNAVYSSGIKDGSGTDPELAQMCAEHGLSARLWDVATNNSKWGYRECSKKSYELKDCDSQVFHEYIMGIANGIGSTKLEYMQGDINSAIVRGVQDGNQNANIMAKMQGATPEDIEAEYKRGLQYITTRQIRYGSEELKTVAGSEDVIPYACGFMHGLAGRYPDGPRRKLAKNYLPGYRHGVSVRLGECEVPSWAR